MLFFVLVFFKKRIFFCFLIGHSIHLKFNFVLKQKKIWIVVLQITNITFILFRVHVTLIMLIDKYIIHRYFIAFVEIFVFIFFPKFEFRTESHTNVFMYLMLFLLFIFFFLLSVIFFFQVDHLFVCQLWPCWKRDRLAQLMPTIFFYLCNKWGIHFYIRFILIKKTH